MQEDVGYLDAKHLEHLADRCERGVELLLYEADNAAHVLSTRGGGDLADPSNYAAHKRSAAAAAQSYALRLRAEAAELGPHGQVPIWRIYQAEKVADAAQLGGILIDGSILTDSYQSTPGASTEMKRAVLDEYNVTRDAIEGSGMFEHVTEAGQVPFWRLTDAG